MIITETQQQAYDFFGLSITASIDTIIQASRKKSTPSLTLPERQNVYAQERIAMDCAREQEAIRSAARGFRPAMRHTLMNSVLMNRTFTAFPCVGDASSVTRLSLEEVNQTLKKREVDLADLHHQYLTQQQYRYIFEDVLKIHPLSKAIEGPKFNQPGSAEAVETLVRLGADVTSSSRSLSSVHHPKPWEPPLISAVSSGDIRMIRAICFSPCPVRLKLRDGIPEVEVLYQLQLSDGTVTYVPDDADSVTHLTTRGAKVLSLAAYCAVEPNKPKMNDSIKDSNPYEKVDRCTYNMASPLAKAALLNKLDIAELLIQAGADVNHCCEELHNVALESQVSAKGLPNVDGPPLACALLNGHIGMANLLLAHGADMEKAQRYLDWYLKIIHHKIIYDETHRGKIKLNKKTGKYELEQLLPEQIATLKRTRFPEVSADEWSDLVNKPYKGFEASSVNFRLLNIEHLAKHFNAASQLRNLQLPEDARKEALILQDLINKITTCLQTHFRSYTEGKNDPLALKKSVNNYDQKICLMLRLNKVGITVAEFKSALADYHRAVSGSVSNMLGMSDMFFPEDSALLSKVFERYIPTTSAEHWPQSLPSLNFYSYLAPDNMPQLSLPVMGSIVSSSPQGPVSSPSIGASSVFHKLNGDPSKSSSNPYEEEEMDSRKPSANDPDVLGR